VRKEKEEEEEKEDMGEWRTPSRIILK